MIFAELVWVRDGPAVRRMIGTEQAAGPSVKVERPQWSIVTGALVHLVLPV